MGVRFSGSVCDELPEAFREQLKRELPTLVNAFEPNRDVTDIYVPRTFSGYTLEYRDKVVLAVETTFADGYERHIVKIGDRGKVEPDFSGWQVCTKGRAVASRIFSSVRLFELENDRVAVLYRDGFTLFGPDANESSDSQPKMLEEAVRWAVFDDRPDPLSAERALAYVYTDLGLWFYRGATANKDLAHAFHAKHLRLKSNEDVLAWWKNSPERKTLRRHAIWILVGRDPPDANSIEKPARYLDPIDYLQWAMRDPQRLPETLVGRAHGDLHARNVLVGVRRGEVQYPAVFDYGDMSNKNVLAWDFAKLETELKARLLPALCRDPEILRFLVQRSGLLKPDISKSRTPSANTAKADRLMAFLAFEELMDGLTKDILELADAEVIRPFALPPTGIPKLDRLAGIILRVRKEAAKWLGFEVPKRKALWKEELYFALAVYGTLNVRWDYSSPEQEAALVSAGVAVARMTSIPPRLHSMIEDPNETNDIPSYRVPLARLYRLWKAKDFTKGVEIAERMVLHASKNERMEVTKLAVRPEVEHAIPLIGQALLLETEVGQLHAVEPVLEGLREQAKEFQDFETLGRIGRLFKDSGDRKWEAEFKNGAGSTITRTPSLQMYDKAFAVYSEAFEATGDWYVGINAATLALLTGRFDQAKDYAKKVADVCAHHHKHDKKDRFWLLATEGEAALILEESEGRTIDFYREALDELSPGQWGMADSSYKQACRLWKVLGSRVEPVLELFETSAARSCLSQRFFGRNFTGGTP